MNFLPLILITVLFFAVIAVLVGVRRTHSSGARLLVGLMAILFFLAMASASIFGFMAAYELQPDAARLPWQAGYGILAGSSLVATVRTVAGAARLRRL